MEIKRCYDTIVGASVGENQLVNADTSSVTIQSGHKYYAKISGTESIGASAGTAISVTGGTDTVIDLTNYFGSVSIANYLYTLEQTTAGAGVAKLREWGFLTDEYIPYNEGSLESVEATAHKMVGFNQWDEEWESGRINAITGADMGGNGIRSKNMIKVLPSTAYHAVRGDYDGASSIVLYYYDADGNFISYENKIGSNVNFTTLANACYIRFNVQTSSAVTTYNHDICINLSSSRNGEYEPYVSHTYNLGTDTLRGIFKLDANNKLYADGDRKTSDGTITRKYKQVTYDGSEAWAKDTDANGYNRYYIADNSVKVLSDYRNNIVNSKGYPIASTCAYGDTGLGDIAVSAYSIAGSSNWVYFGLKTSLNIGTVADFKTWLTNNHVTVVLPLSTPTTETGDPFTSPQVCYPDGTEEYLTGNGVPVGHETRYEL